MNHSTTQIKSGVYLIADTTCIKIVDAYAHLAILL